MQFTIQRDNVLTGFVCGGAMLAFAVTAKCEGGGVLSFRGTAIARSSPAGSWRTESALGTIDTDDCPGTRWAAVETVVVGACDRHGRRRTSDLSTVIAANLRPAATPWPAASHASRYRARR